jgi:hypothetical protein
MRPIQRLLAAFALAAGIAGCGGPELIVETIPPVPGRAYFRPIRDGAGNEYPPTTPLTSIGDVPTEWEVPENLLGGHGYVRVDFVDGRQTEVYDFAIQKTKDTKLRVAPPPRVQ